MPTNQPISSTERQRIVAELVRRAKQAQHELRILGFYHGRRLYPRLHAAAKTERITFLAAARIVKTGTERVSAGGESAPATKNLPFPRQNLAPGDVKPTDTTT